MDFSKITLFQAMKKRVAWLNQRQEVLAQNIANTDTPGARARELEPFSFERLIRREEVQLNMASTSGDHMGGRRKRVRDYSTEETRKPYETAPTGNAIVIEEQMMKLNETGIQHKLMTELYKKHLKMFRTAISGG
jgi:flagellar basal-body rod protein FlgB